MNRRNCDRSRAEIGSLRTIYAVLSFSLLVFQIAAVLGAIAQPAYAYVDPGSGLLAVQILSTSLAGMIFLVRRRLRQFLGRIARFSGSHNEKAAK
jgi:hypothetical protein